MILAPPTTSVNASSEPSFKNLLATISLGQLAVLLLVVHSPCQSRQQMATKLHMSKRMVAYHLAALRQNGLLERTRRFDPRNGNPIIEIPNTAIAHRVPGLAPRQLPNRWAWNEAIAPFVLSPDGVGIKSIIRLRRRQVRGTKGAKTSRLLIIVMDVLAEMARRLRVRLPQALMRFYRRLRKRYYLAGRPVQSLDERREYYLRPPPVATLAQRKAYYIGVRS